MGGGLHPRRRGCLGPESVRGAEYFAKSLRSPETSVADRGRGTTTTASGTTPTISTPTSTTTATMITTITVTGTAQQQSTSALPVFGVRYPGQTFA